MLIMQNRDEVLSDVKLRQAIAHAIDREAVTEVATAGLGEMNPSSVAPQSSFFEPEFEKMLEYDPEKARSLLAESDYDGEPIQLITSTVNSQINNSAIAIQSMLTQVGINARIEVLDWAAQYNNYNEGTYQMMVMGYSARPDATMAYNVLVGDKDERSNVVVGDHDIIAAVKESGNIADPEKRRAKLLWLGQVVTGDLGTSIKTGESVTSAIAAAFPVTASIVVAATALAAAFAIPAGLLAAWRQNTSVDVAIIAIATLFLSIPSFWMALMLLSLFGVVLGWLPTIGYVSLFEDPVQGAIYLILPVTALFFTELATLTRMSRSSTIEVLRLDYISHARAKGLPERTVLWKHALPNAFAPTSTVIGLILGNLLSGAAVIETMFSLPGIGRLIVDAVFSRDYPVVQGVLLFVVFLYVVVNLLVDLLYPVFDPRVRL